MVGPSTLAPFPSSWLRWWVCWLCTCSLIAIGSCELEREPPTTSKARPSHASPATATVIDAARVPHPVLQTPRTLARPHQWAWRPSGRCPPLSCPCTRCPRAKRAPQQLPITPRRGTTTSCRSTTAFRKTWKTQAATATPPIGALHLYETEMDHRRWHKLEGCWGGGSSKGKERGRNG